MLKKDTLGTASAKSLDEVFKCGECVHFKQHAHSSRQQVCSKEGVRAVGIAPKCFTPDVTVIAQNSDHFVQVAAMFQAFSPKQKRIFLALLRSSKKKPYNMGTKLYFKVGKDFISNYLCGYVAGYTSSGELMLIGSPDRKTRGTSFVSYLSPSGEGLLTYSEWKTKRQVLKEHNLVHDPANRVIKRASVVDDYEPPTIDNAPSSWYDKKAPVKRRKTDALSFQIS
jgi:hypothetical protein